jgi:Peptidase family M28
MRVPGSASFVLVIAVATACAAPITQLRFGVVNPQIVEQRLKSYSDTDVDREATIKALFQSAGCSEGRLIEQAVKGSKLPNVICILPGRTDSVIVVGANFDHAEVGDGVIDNWSGASMLPSLYQALNIEPRRHTFVFVAFAGQKQGSVGSRSYVDSLTPEQEQKIDAMVDIDLLGLGPTEVWVNRSDQKLVRALNGMAVALKVPLTGANIDWIAEFDEGAFVEHKVPTITVHSLIKAMPLPLLHLHKDNYSAVRFDDYYKSYRLLSAYLVLLDGLAAR